MDEPGSEISKTEKEKYCMISLNVESKKKAKSHFHRNREQKNACQELREGEVRRCTKAANLTL